MMHRDLVRKIPDDLWEPIDDQISELGRKWIPVLSVSSATLGMTDVGKWAVKKASTTQEANAKETARLLVFLERPLSDLTESVMEKFGRSLGSEIVKQTPFEDIVRAGLVQGSDYWADLALSWCEELQCGSVMVKELQEVQTAKWASQHTRQKAKRILKRT